MTARILAIGIAVALSATAAWSQPAGRLVVSGSTTMAPLVSEMAQRFTKLHPAIQVEVRSGGSGKGISDLRAGANSIAMVSRVLLDTERDFFQIPIARDGIALIVNRDNPVKALSAQQAAAIFTGRTSNWKAVGGRAAPVGVIWRSKGQGAAELLAEYLKLTHGEVRAQAIIVENSALIREVEGQPDAIAPVSVGDAERMAAAGTRIRLLAFDGVAASSRTILSGSYPLSRPLSLVTRRLPEGVERRFVEFALSGHVADLFAKYDFVAYQD